MGVDLDSFQIKPNVAGKGSHGGYAGPAVKPIALHMVSAVAADADVRGAGLPISGMGGIQTWRDAAEFLLLGATSLQVCTAVMHYGFRIIDDLLDGLNNWLDERGVGSIREVIGASVPRISSFGDFDLSYKTVARIDTDTCIHCNLCYVACDEGAHQCIDLVADGKKIDPASYQGNGKVAPVVREDDCVGCNLCSLVCPVDGCITMVELPPPRPSITWNRLIAERPEVLDWDEMEKYRKEAGIDIH